MPPSRRAARPSDPVAPGAAPAVLVLGPEDFLADRFVATTVAEARAAEPTLEQRDVDLSGERALGELVAALSPNLFGDAAVVVARSAEAAEPVVLDALVAAVTDGLPGGVRLLVLHPGGVKGRGGADRLKKAGFVVAACERPKGRAVDEFVAAEFARLGRTASTAATAALRTALGDDLRLLAAAAAQLDADVLGIAIGADDVATYYDGVADVPGYLISDAVWDGRGSEVVRRTRLALLNDPGIAPAISAAVASGLRAVGRYASAPAGLPEGQLAAHVGVPPWKLRDLRGRANRWHPAALARAVGELAVTNAAVKGRDASGRVLEESGLDREQGTFLLERALLRIVSRRS